MRREIAAQRRFLVALIGINFREALEYRASFLIGVSFMVINDGMWIAFWGLFFRQFPVIRGWELRDIVTMWAVSAAGFGVAAGFFGNCHFSGARLIAEGRLDYHLSTPKSTLLHYLMSSMVVSAWGDVIFGVTAFTLVVRPTPAHLALFLMLVLTSAVIFVSFGLIANSLAFWAGNSEGLANQMLNALISFSTYPLDLFSIGVKVVLFSLLPAAFVSYLPVRLLREPSWGRLLLLEAFAWSFAALAAWIFSRGLRRYESGNLIVMRG